MAVVFTVPAAIPSAYKSERAFSSVTDLFALSDKILRRTTRFVEVIPSLCNYLPPRKALVFGSKSHGFSVLEISILFWQENRTRDPDPSGG
jgi:hypothetical protein